MGSKLSTLGRGLAIGKMATVPPPGDDALPSKAKATLHPLSGPEEAPPHYDTRLQPCTSPRASNQCQYQTSGPPQRPYAPGLLRSPSRSNAPVRWDIHDLESDQHHLLEGESFVVMTSQSRGLLGRPVIIAAWQCIRDVDSGEHFRPGTAICMLGFYHELRRALLRESDPAVLRRLEDYRQKILVAARRFKAKIIERSAMMITQHDSMEHWWICNSIVCWDVGKVDILYKHTNFRGILHAAQVEHNLRWIRLWGVNEGGGPDTQQPFCFDFDPQFSECSESPFMMTAVVVEDVPKE